MNFRVVDRDKRIKATHGMLRAIVSPSCLLHCGGRCGGDGLSRGFSRAVFLHAK